MFPVYRVAFECSTLSCPVPKKGKREKWKEEKREYWLFKSPGSHFSWKGEKLATVGGGATTTTTTNFLFAGISEIRSSKQWSEHTYPIFGRQSPFLPTQAPAICVCCSRNRCTAACYGAGNVGGGAATVLTAEIDLSWPQFTVQAFSWKLKAFSRL